MNLKMKSVNIVTITTATVVAEGAIVEVVLNAARVSSKRLTISNNPYKLIKFFRNNNYQDH